MKQFLRGLWNSPLKGTLVALPAMTIGMVVNHLAGVSGQLTLPAQTLIDALLIWGGSLFAACGVAFSYYRDLETFKREHEEEERIKDGISFRRGKRTGGNWMAFCPVCQRPADLAITARCPDAKCKWTTYKDRNEIERMITEL